MALTLRFSFRLDSVICDRVILVSVSWDDLNAQGYVTGKTVTIDGAKYKCRLLTGGSNYRNTSDAYAGGTPTNNEWDRFITREEVISGLPAPLSSDLDTTLNATDKSSAHNQFWTWMGHKPDDHEEQDYVGPTM